MSEPNETYDDDFEFVKEAFGDDVQDVLADDAAADESVADGQSEGDDVAELRRKLRDAEDRLARADALIGLQPQNPPQQAHEQPRKERPVLSEEQRLKTWQDLAGGKSVDEFIEDDIVEKYYPRLEERIIGKLIALAEHNDQQKSFQQVFRETNSDLSEIPQYVVDGALQEELRLDRTLAARPADAMRKTAERIRRDGIYGKKAQATQATPSASREPRSTAPISQLAVEQHEIQPLDNRKAFWMQEKHRAAEFRKPQKA